MIDLYTWTTPNGRKISIALEELGLPYKVYPVNISNGEQFAPEFLKISPNNKIPAIVDHDTGVSVFESGAILIYLAEKTASPLLPSAGPARAATLEWLMFQMGSVGPMFGQLGHFGVFASEKIPYAIKRYRDETLRILGVMEKRLGGAPFLAGDYSIADIAAYPWVVAALTGPLSAALDPANAPEHARVNDWIARIGARDAVKRGIVVPG